MKHRQLGSTGMQISELTLGTVELGVDYGFRGSTHARKPDLSEAGHVIHRAMELGINFIDTARAYGISEEIIGAALAEVRQRPYVATKVLIPLDQISQLTAGDLQELITESVEASLKALRIETIDLLQVHHTTSEVLRNDDILKGLEKLRQDGKVRFLGVSLNGEAMALEALTNPLFRTIQVPFNLLDQKMAERVFPAAEKEGVGILVRSVFLRGVLTPQLEEIPSRLAPLKEKAYGVLAALGAPKASLAQVALRFCLSFPQISSVIVGVRSAAELEANVSAAEEGLMPNKVVQKLQAFSTNDETLVSPDYWQDLILG